VTERLEDTLRRLAKEREEADRRYNDALTALDRARPVAAPLPPPRPASDEHQLATLNEAWNILPAAPDVGGVKGRLAGFVWRVIGPYLQRQLTFNSLLVDHLNRTAAAARDSDGAAQQVIASLEQRLAEIDAFTGRLLLYVQQITGYVDTKDRESASGALVLNASISGMADSLDKRWESLNARFETRTAALAASHETLRTAVAVAQQASQSLKRELERLLVKQPELATAGAAARVDPGTAAPGEAFAPALDSFKYVGFEDQFRGSREAIRRRLEGYVPRFAGAQDVLDVGCGRGEFLELLRAAGVACRGIDINHEMVEQCRSRGLDVTEADAVGYLDRLPDASLGGIFSAQVVEHLQPSYLLRFLELGYHKLRPGGTMILETLNPACWVAFFDSYLRDITHVWPLHPDTLKYLVLASGFTQAEVEYRSPVGDEHKLQTLTPARGADDTLAALTEAFNENARKLNARLFTHLDYAVIARK
jgi:O-antigen chain-terminating methyltransferase